MSHKPDYSNFVNDSGATLYGKTSEELAGKKLEELFPAHMAVQFKESIKNEIESALRKKEEVYMALFNASSDPIIIGEINGKILDCNNSACLLFGYVTTDLMEYDGKQGIVAFIRDLPCGLISRSFLEPGLNLAGL